MVRPKFEDEAWNLQLMSPGDNPFRQARLALHFSPVLA
ncbi:hypothetical protein A2U01_0075224, partial [Trifolium medium]|nr:hypothetical protein [Trifolium medium]